MRHLTYLCKVAVVTYSTKYWFVVTLVHLTGIYQRVAVKTLGQQIHEQRAVSVTNTTSTRREVHDLGDKQGQNLATVLNGQFLRKRSKEQAWFVKVPSVLCRKKTDISNRTTQNFKQKKRNP